MNIDRSILKSRLDLITLFNGDRCCISGQEVFPGIYGTQKHLKEMPEYELDYSPYIELARWCGMKSMSLKVSEVTGRVYLWNVNIGGHGPRLELMPVSFNQVEDPEFMKKMHENHAYNIGLEVDSSASYKI